MSSPDNPAYVDWRDHAACAGCDPGLFYPEQGGDYRSAKAVCRLCPVTQECLDFAIGNHEKYGVWGGMSERQRKRYRAQLGGGIGTRYGGTGNRGRVRPAVCGTNGGYYAHRRLGTTACQACRDAHADAERARTAHELLNANRDTVNRRYSDHWRLITGGNAA